MSDDKTKYEYYRAQHMALWRWLAENPGKEKDEWPGWSYNDGQLSDVTNDCFACEYTNYPANNEYRAYNCERCPIQWTFQDGTVTKDCQCSDDYSYKSTEYVCWYTSGLNEAEDAPQRVKYAQKIAGMWPEWDDRHHKDIVRERLSEVIDQQQELIEAYRWRDECNQAYCEFHGWHRWGISNTSYVCGTETYYKRAAARQAIFSNYVNACEEISRLEGQNEQR